ncbi:aspartyl-phosphate phosphatase Spo0E family protein [Pelosinus sp. UFO1]|uniref:aspartyl-phosphate phosphatase Spo0E family protein n=1 Tax=Pelosinus sp. UFO1 TaxID=484770 RepID=UPI0004D1349E|nr:aspartyl-phosphate phosphatase Spo0E family protein [Pelosinus sp. UFO1]AIF52959.1 Sporulation stage 0, Spo0E-like regulatory phosphatase [Pelosinus sp. UFO1]
MSDLTSLQEMIEKLRTELYKISQEKLLTDPEVVRASQMLDVLLVEYQKLLRDKSDK